MLKYVYVMGFGDPQMVKVGVSDDPCKRMLNVANQLGVQLDTCRIYMSPLQKDPYVIETKCRAALSEFLIGGYGPNKKYKREVFQCDLGAAKKVLDHILEQGV